eukprot:1905528-Pleurochrysis_carterae.AAC.1
MSARRSRADSRVCRSGKVFQKLRSQTSWQGRANKRRGQVMQTSGEVMQTSGEGDSAQSERACFSDAGQFSEGDARNLSVLQQART